MERVIKLLILGKYKSLTKFWKAYQEKYNDELSTSYRYKINSGYKKIPIKMMMNIYELLEIGNNDIIDLVYYGINLLKTDIPCD